MALRQTPSFTITPTSANACSTLFKSAWSVPTRQTALNVLVRKSSSRRFTKEIQEWLGHSHISTTSNIYTHLDFSSKVSSANAIVSIFPENTKVWLATKIKQPGTWKRPDCLIGADGGTRTHMVSRAILSFYPHLPSRVIQWYLMISGSHCAKAKFTTQRTIIWNIHDFSMRF